MVNIAIVDDDPLAVEILTTILKGKEFSISTYHTPIEILPDLENHSFDIIISDYFMPRMNGDQFLAEVKRRGLKIPFLFITANDDVADAVELIKQGAYDYITKPIVRDEVLFRIRKTLREAETVKILKRVRQEKAIHELEEKKLVNWRNLYAAKDIKQTETLIKLFSKTINQSGVFLLLDLFRDQIEKIDDSNYRINASFANLIMDAARKNETIFNQMNLINQLDDIQFQKISMTPGEFGDKVRQCLEEHKKYCDAHGRTLNLDDTPLSSQGIMEIDFHYFEKILKEMVLNGIKYSPEGSEISFYIEENDFNEGRKLDLISRNMPRNMNKKDLEENDIWGIPYEYSELVFDLFYRIDESQPVLPEEEWSDGVGLYVVRKILKRQGCWISAKNGVLYLPDKTLPFVQFTLSIPLK